MARLSDTVGDATVGSLVIAAETRWDAVVQQCMEQLEGRGSPLVARPARDFVRDELYLVLRDLVAFVGDGRRIGVPQGPDADTVEVAAYLVRGGVQPAEVALAAGTLFESAIAVVFDDVGAVGPWEPVVRFCAVLHTAVSSRLVRGYQAWHLATHDELRLRLAGSVGPTFGADSDTAMSVDPDGYGSRYDGLTGREREVLQLAAGGLTNRRIAALLDIREGTVRTHLHHVFRKLNATGRVDAVNKAASWELIPPPKPR